MKRLLSSTTALSLALTSVQPWPLMAQTLLEDGSVVAADGSVLCAPAEGAPCDPAAFAEQAKAIEDAMAAAQAEAEAQAAAEAEAAAQAEAEAQAAAEAEAAAQAEAEAKAAAEAEAAAQAEAEAKAAAEAEAAAQAEAEAKAAAEAEAAAQAEAEAKAAAEAEAAAQAEAEAKAAEEPAAEEPAAEEPAAEEPAAEEPVAEEPVAEEPATEEPVAEEPAAEEPAAEEPAAEEPPAEEPAAEEATAEEPAPAPEKSAEEIAAEEAARAAAEAELAVQPDGTIEDPAAGLKTEEVAVDPDVEPVDAPVVSETEVETLTEILAEPEAIDPAALEATSALVETPKETERKPVEEMEVSAEAVQTVVETLTEENTRTSEREFAAPPVQVAEGKKDRLSDLEKVGLFALGALVVGAIINEGKKDEERQVVSNTGDRVIVLKPDGTYQVYKDDDAVLRRPGSTVRTETFRDGSTRTIVERADGTQVVTIRDASGRVLRRAAYDELGREIVLIDDLYEEEVVIVEDLPKPKKKRVTISMQDEDAALKAKLAAKEAAKAGRKFSLRQVREIPEVRALAATIEVDNVTFDSGSAAIKASEADSLADLGSLMQELLEANPAEVFLIEGHTDAVGKAAMNLALSDRRAESVALALTEYFDIPPENMVVQGYGETELLIDTQEDERRNRRVAVRIITPLLRISE